MKKNNYTSIYNEYVLKDDKVYVYNTQLMNVIRFNSDSIESVKSYLEEVNDETLKNLGFIRDNDYEVEEGKYNYNKMAYTTKKLNIMIVMTYKCNAKCSYCFEDINKSLLKENNNNLVNICEYISNQYFENNYEELELSFFGGEPSLKVNKICETLKNLNKRKVNGKKINLKSLMITNGTLLDEENVLKLKENGLKNYQITLDGPKKIHDVRRPLKNGKSCWDAIINSSEAIFKNDCYISLRINVDEDNVEDLENLYRSLPKPFFNDKNNMYIAPVVGVLRGSVKETLKKRAHTLKRAWAIIKEKDLSKLDISPPVYAPCPYHSETSAYYIDLNGNIYTCGGFVGKCEKIEGNFSNKNKNFYNRVNYIPEEKCFNCSFYYVCMGSCQFEKESIKANCQYSYLKEVFDDYFTKYAK